MYNNCILIIFAKKNISIYRESFNIYTANRKKTSSGNINTEIKFVDSFETIKSLLKEYKGIKTLIIAGKYFEDDPVERLIQYIFNNENIILLKYSSEVNISNLDKFDISQSQVPITSIFKIILSKNIHSSTLTNDAEKFMSSLAKILKLKNSEKQIKITGK